ncbi:hypothetical protein DV712_13010 [Parageobacillus thermoglucosidasius]|nr:hypothetical protein DV712_13010 [Parageobacillus thermoglucosidasius]
MEKEAAQLFHSMRENHLSNDCWTFM